VYYVHGRYREDTITIIPPGAYHLFDKIVCKTKPSRNLKNINETRKRRQAQTKGIGERIWNFRHLAPS
jgi:hypothetical protein